MFTINHFIWLAVCCCIVVVSMWLLKKYKLPLKTVLTIACVVAACSEIVKVFSSIELVSSADGTKMYPYIKMQHLPLHLCSLQILFIFYARFAKEGKKKEILYAFMYPSCVIGAFFALLLPSIFTATVPVERAFTHLLPYQFFLYHSMLIVVGLYIPLSGEVRLRTKHYFTTLAFLGIVAFLSLYVNSMFAMPQYEAGQLISVEYIPNFFFTYETPIGVALTELWHWYLYLIILLVLAVSLIAVFYIPFFIRDRKEKKLKNQENTENTTVC